MAEQVEQQKVDNAKRWLLIKFREMLKGAKLTDQVTRYLSGELGSSYRFHVDIGLDENALNFIGDPANADKLKAENL